VKTCCIFKTLLLPIYCIYVSLCDFSEQLLSPYGIKWLGLGNLDSVCVSCDAGQNK